MKWIFEVHNILLTFFKPAHTIYIIELNVQLKEDKMDNMWLALHWGSPIGIGIFLVCLGAMVYLFSKADELSKRTKAFAKEKGLERKKE